MMNEYLPIDLYRFMFDISCKHKISVKEVKVAMLRAVAQELGFVCDHFDIKYAEKTGLPFCKRCWTRMEELTQPVMGVSKKGKKVVKTPGEYRALPTFLDWERRTREEEEMAATRKKLEEAASSSSSEDNQQQQQQRQTTDSSSSSTITTNEASN
jgi:hypothetical protein